MSSPSFNVSEAKMFWECQARRLGAFRHASSTGYYRAGEIRILENYLGTGTRLKVLKLDLWNEVKNTNILAWLAERGADVFAIDISSTLAREAATLFRQAGLIPRFSVASLYQLPFRSESFDLLYTMGTIEHATDMTACVREIYRVLKPGGIAIVGVPNAHDPFLRPWLVALMNSLNLYPYGFEQALTSAGLQRLLRQVGFETLEPHGVLFMPGIVRMAELALLRDWPKLSRWTGALHWPFRWLSERFPALNQHGYLVAWAARRPAR